MGARFDDRESGTIGDAGAFSFFPTKNLGGFGDGGLITTNDPDLADRLSLLRLHGGRKMYHHEFVGTNSRLDALQAADLRVKLRELNGYIAARRAHAAVYNEALTGIEELLIPAEVPGRFHSYNQYTVRSRRARELQAHLARIGIGSKVYYPAPLHLQECFDDLGYAAGSLPTAEILCGEVLSLPIFPELGTDRAARVAQAVRHFFLS